MNRREFLSGLGAAAMIGGFGLMDRAMAAPVKKPNFLFILMDDMGWADLGCYGSKYHETPNIDKLAARGMRFTQAYAACPVCSPTRASIMTGRYPARIGLTDWIAGHKKQNPKLLVPAFHQELPLNEVTIAEVLKANGYTTGIVGKWHLGTEPFYPEKQGFDTNFGGTHRGSTNRIELPEAHDECDHVAEPVAPDAEQGQVHQRCASGLGSLALPHDQGR